MIAYVVSFMSYKYPEDCDIRGIYSTEEKAKQAIHQAIEDDKRDYPDHPGRYQKFTRYYRIEEFEVDK